MERDFETVMIEQCAPVLAGLKPAGLFRYETRNRADLARRVAGWNAQLNPKGLQVRVLRGCIATRQYQRRQGGRGDGCGHGFGLLGRGAPQGADPIIPHYIITAAGRVARVRFAINNFFAGRA